MRRPSQVERLYLDFDGFFASVEQFYDKSLRGRPIGVVPFDGAQNTSVIACSREAKMQGVKNVMGVNQAKKVCPDIIFIPQKPDIYRRIHLRLLAEITTILPIDAVKSIDELTCRVEPDMRDQPDRIAQNIKAQLEKNFGKVITCSIGMAANRHLAKIACKAGKRNQLNSYGDGLAIWKPQDMPGPLLDIQLDDIPGIGRRNKIRLLKANIVNTELLLRLEAKHMRKLWGNVSGERLWYALHGYDIEATPSERGIFGHSRVLPPQLRDFKGAYNIARLLLVKAARRLRNEGYYCSSLWLSLSIDQGHWADHYHLPVVCDDQAVLHALSVIWSKAENILPEKTKIFKIFVTLGDITRAEERQLDLLLHNDTLRKKWERANQAMDWLNHRYSNTVIHLGDWKPPEGGHAGGKISYTRIPSVEDFW